MSQIFWRTASVVEKFFFVVVEDAADGGGGDAAEAGDVGNRGPFAHTPNYTRIDFFMAFASELCQ